MIADVHTILEELELADRWDDDGPSYGGEENPEETARVWPEETSAEDW